MLQKKGREGKKTHSSDPLDRADAASIVYSSYSQSKLNGCIGFRLTGKMVMMGDLGFTNVGSRSRDDASGAFSGISRLNGLRRQKERPMRVVAGVRGGVIRDYYVSCQCSVTGSGGRGEMDGTDAGSSTQ